MRTTIGILLAIIAILGLGVGTLYFTGNLFPVLFAVFKPHHGWNPSLQAAAPNYDQAAAWAALPTKASSVDLVPVGVAPSTKNPQVDVFFVHPTGFMYGTDWNSPLEPNSQTEENTRWTMANQASVFNGCCAIYAPRYREASVFTYLANPPSDLAKKSMDLAYGDVDRAFSYFLEHYSHDRPFIIASHSQGTDHALRLIQERIDGTPLAQRMVVAYLIGGNFTDNDIAALKSVGACTTETDLHCIVQWLTVGEGARLEPTAMDPTPQYNYLCTNPLTWKRNGTRAPASAHKGGVPPTGRFQIKFWGSDTAQQVTFGPLKAPVKTWTWAECRKGHLFVADQTRGPFDGLDLGDEDYHLLDYPLFYMDIRLNAQTRIQAYLAGRILPDASEHQ